ncbi:alpha/beta hydrolase [Blastococcus sp. URHD0036]|uniref:alpha/beta hydrolase n=1 Tax=Blastococcus sp. URHD0036 TaxID=1380356 RepID=UPI000495A0E5|nr:alpha/beta fold hydrolase [Blastococcus sp. URHD0036]
MSEPVRVVVDVREVAPAGGECVVVDVFAPPPGTAPTGVLWWLLPGGGMSRRYWDLDVPGHSLARALAARGHVAVTVDHLGVGESSVPDDPYELTAHTVADVNAYVLARLRDGELVPGRPGTVLGLGHSAGAGLLVTQQSRHGGCDALALLGYGGRGMPEKLDADAARYADDPDGLRRALPDLVRERFGTPLPDLDRRHGRSHAADDGVKGALARASAPLLALVGLASMVPGNARDEIAALDVPVFLAHGDREIGAPLDEIAPEFVGTGDLTLFRVPDSGHHHVVSPNRALLVDRLLRWAGSVLPQEVP